MDPNYLFRYAKKHSICQSEVGPFLGLIICTIIIIDNKKYIYDIIIYIYILFIYFYQTEYSGRSSGRIYSGPGIFQAPQDKGSSSYRQR